MALVNDPRLAAALLARQHTSPQRTIASPQGSVGYDRAPGRPVFGASTRGGLSTSLRLGVPVANHALWLDTTYLNMTAAQVWLMPTPQYANCVDHLNGFIVLSVDYFSGTGTLTVDVQSCPVMSSIDAAWQTVATTTVNATGPQVFRIVRGATTPMTGLLRLKITCNTNPVQATVRADLLLKQACEYKLVEWVKSAYLNFTGAGDLVMPADLWANVEGFLNVFLLVDFDVMSGSGSNLTIKLETSPAFTVDANAWQQVGTALTMSATPKVYDGRLMVTHAPQGTVRLKYSAAAALAGNLRVQALFKDK